MNTKHISFAALAIVAVLAACTKNPIETPSDSNRFADLELTSVNSVQTKATIDGTTFPTDGEIGLFLFADETADTPYGDGYANVEYSYNSTKGKWTASPSIKVGSTPGYLYGYYPYNSASTDIKAIPVASSLNGDDVMYATSQTVTDKTASQTTITMNHALSRVAITVVNKGYTGAAKLSSIKFAGAKTSAAGTLNALNGNITATKADVTLDIPAASQDITAAGTTYDCLLVPSAEDESKQTVTLTLTIDGVDKTATLSADNGVIIAQNTKSNITVTLSNSGISVQTVSVEDWNVVEIGGQQVTILVADGVDPNDILTKAYVDGDNVIIKAYSETGQHLKCTMPDGEFCTSQSKTENLVYTFTISDITESTTATIGYANPVSIAVSPFNVRCKVTIKDGEPYEGETVRIVPEAAYSYGISSWKDQNDDLLSDGYDYTVRLSKDVQITACFEENLVLGGVFTVANDDKGNVKKVRFTRGNLYFDRSISIERHQYDFNAGEWEDDGHISHFMWCKTLNGSVNQQYAETGTSASDTFFTNQSSFTVNGFREAGTCFALSNGEWTYLINTRNTSTVNGTSNARYFKGCINNEDGGSINGLFIFPDTFTWPPSVKTQPTGINDASAGYSNTYTYNDFKRLQDAGIVFLPAAGYRNGSTGNTSISFAGSIGCYWSASLGTNSALVLHFNISIVRPDSSDSRGQANSVRLVTEYN